MRLSAIASSTLRSSARACSLLSDMSTSLREHEVEDQGDGEHSDAESHRLAIPGVVARRRLLVVGRILRSVHQAVDLIAARLRPGEREHDPDPDADAEGDTRLDE